MICDKCGKSIADDSLFCAECGVRLDECVVCKNCGAVNEKQEQNCVKCGVRLDGKEYCVKCGALVDGVYCEKCGKKREGIASPVKVVAVQNLQLEQAKPKATFASGFRKVEKILTPVLLLLSLLILFCCSFGVGVSVDTSSAAFAAESGFVNKSGGILYFFVQSFMDTKALISAYATDVNYQAVLMGMQTPNVISLIAIIINLIVVIACFISAAIKTGIAFKNGEKPKIYRQTITAFVVFFVCATIVKDANNAYIECFTNNYYSCEYFYVSMSVGSVLGIIFSIGPILLSFVLTQISLGKQFKSYDNLSRLIPSAIAVFFLLFINGFMSETVVIVMENFGEEVVQSEYTLSSLMTSTFYSVLNASDPTQMEGAIVVLIIFYVAHLINILSFGALLKVSADVLFGEQVNRKWVLGLAISAFALCVVVSILPVLIYSSNISIAYQATSNIVGGGLGAGVGAPFVMSLLVMGCAITYFALNKSKKQNN